LRRGLGLVLVRLRHGRLRGEARWIACLCPEDAAARRPLHLYLVS
jgi:hypothetical protein